MNPLSLAVVVLAAASSVSADDFGIDGLKRRAAAIPAAEGRAAGARDNSGCPQEMAAIDDKLCIDKWEASVVDAGSGDEASPYYVPESGRARSQHARWKAKPSKNEAKYPLPPLPAAHASKDFRPKAVSRPDVYPQGFATHESAGLACENAGKRLCTRMEWYKACAGSANTKAPYSITFPYGPKYEKGKCNFNVRLANGFSILGRSNTELDDPRFMLIESGGERLLQKTGAYKDCRDAAGDQGFDVYDMVGNQDEIVSDDGVTKDHMTFVGSFYNRWQKDGPRGCASSIKSHGKGYFDYSIGFRCCKNREKK